MVCPPHSRSSHFFSHTSASYSFPNQFFFTMFTARFYITSSSFSLLYQLFPQISLQRPLSACCTFLSLSIFNLFPSIVHLVTTIRYPIYRKLSRPFISNFNGSTSLLFHYVILFYIFPSRRLLSSPSPAPFISFI